MKSKKSPLLNRQTMFKAKIFLIFALFACNGNSQQVVTPREFLNRVTVEESVYSQDSAVIVADLYAKMKNHEASFSNREYFDSTILVVDTIMYDSTLNKIALFVIAKNPTYRNPYSTSELPHYYNASCYLGKRMSLDSSRFELKNMGPFSIINFSDKELVRRAIREYYFLELATVLNEKNQPRFKYNLDDKRFWESSTGWKRAFD
jgi:hypothetical protein